jgi:hypothetical protein
MDIDFGEDGVAGGEIIELIPGAAIEYHWRFTGEPDSIVRFELDVVDPDKTRLASITGCYRSTRRPAIPRDGMPTSISSKPSPPARTRSTGSSDTRCSSPTIGSEPPDSESFPQIEEPIARMFPSESLNQHVFSPSGETRTPSTVWNSSSRS